MAGRPGLYVDLLDLNIQVPDVVAFLTELHRRIGRATVVRNRDKIHSQSKVAKLWLVKYSDLVCESFPGFMPDLNTVECV